MFIQEIYRDIMLLIIIIAGICICNEIVNNCFVKIAKNYIQAT